MSTAPRTKARRRMKGVIATWMITSKKRSTIILNMKFRFLSLVELIIPGFEAICQMLTKKSRIQSGLSALFGNCHGTFLPYYGDLDIARVIEFFLDPVPDFVGQNRGLII